MDEVEDEALGELLGRIAEKPEGSRSEATVRFDHADGVAGVPQEREEHLGVLRWRVDAPLAIPTAVGRARWLHWHPRGPRRV